MAELPIAELRCRHSVSWDKQHPVVETAYLLFSGVRCFTFGLIHSLTALSQCSGASRALGRGSWKTLGINVLGAEVGVPALLAEPASQETQIAQDNLTTGYTVPLTLLIS